MSEWNQKRIIMRRYDSTAHIYDMRYAEEQAAKIKAALEIIDIKKESIALDVGCGTGILFNYIADKAQTVVGLDISRKILLLAKKQARDFQNVHLVLADADDLPLNKNVFTYIFGITVLQNMPNPTETLKEIVRVAKEKAIIIVTAMKKAFTLKNFEEMLQNAGLKVMCLKSEDLKCYVAVCTRIHCLDAANLLHS